MSQKVDLTHSEFRFSNEEKATKRQGEGVTWGKAARSRPGMTIMEEFKAQLERVMERKIARITPPPSGESDSTHGES